MHVLLTGADTHLGRLAAAALAADHTLRATGAGADPGLGLPYMRADLRDPAAAAEAVAGCEAVLHLAPYALADGGAPDAELLDLAGCGTYVLAHAARAAGVTRLVLASRLELVADHGPEVVVDETWRPLPRPDAASLAPWMAELVVREFVRAEPLEGICLRLGPLGEGPGRTAPSAAVAALRDALTREFTPPGHRWRLLHGGVER